MIRLLEAHLPFRISIVTEDVRDLFQDQNDTDSCQQPLDHTKGEESGDETQPKGAHQNLNRSRNHDRCQESFKTAQQCDLSCNNRC